MLSHISEFNLKLHINVTKLRSKRGVNTKPFHFQKYSVLNFTPNPLYISKKLIWIIEKCLNPTDSKEQKRL